MLLQDSGEGSSRLFHDRPVLSLDHYAGHLLGTGVAQQDAATGPELPLECRLGVLKSGDCFEGGSFAHWHVREDLWEAF